MATDGREAFDRGGKLALRVNPEIAELLHGEENRIINDLERSTEKRVVVYPTANFHFEEYDIIEILNE